MNTQQITFFLINLIGGILVIGSYYIGLKSGKDIDALWGGVPTNLRSVYATSMLISAISYLIFFAYIFRNLGTGLFDTAPMFGEKTYLILFTIILLASSFWMPLVNVMVANPSLLIWIGIRVVLALVALAALGVFLSLLNITPKQSGLFYYSALVGMLLFTFHTGILDALLWPYLWGK